MSKNKGPTKVCVITRTGKQLMPTDVRHARRLLKKGRAEIACHRPFTIRLLDRDDGEVQPMEAKVDTGYQTIGFSVCTEKQELFSEERELLKGEKGNHKKRKMYRRNRRSGKRYRKPRYDNRCNNQMCKDGLAPSIRNKRDQHVQLIERYCKVLPITDIYIEVGTFDTQVLEAAAAGNPVPEGLDYQHGPSYGFNTLRDAVFERDHYTCKACGKSAFRDHVILRTHHVGYWMGDRSNRLGNLITVCNECHNSQNHQKGGKLWGLKPTTNKLPQAAFMNTVRWSMLEKIKDALPDVTLHLTYGAATKEMRRVLRVRKSHANDAYAMGRFHPKKRAQTTYWRKRRRNNRVLEKFFDAKYIDIRDGKEKSGKELSSDRTNRSQKRNGPGSLRGFRAGYAACRKRDGSISPRKDDKGRIIRDIDGRPIPKLKKGYRQIRHQRYPIRPGDTVIVYGKKQKAKGTHHKGTSLVLSDGRTTAISKVEQVIHAGGWERIN